MISNDVVLLLISLVFDVSIAFSSVPIRSEKYSLPSLSALTERQMQFWEDVEEGLNGIESLYKSKGMNIDRVRRFAKSASGEILPPTGSQPFHQPCEEYIEGLTAKPFWNVTENLNLFPWAVDLEAQADVIATEFMEKLQRDQEEKNIFAGDSVWQNQVMGGGWSAVRLMRLGVWNAKNCREFPKTYEILRSLDIPFAVRGVCFARQEPGSGVKPHSDGRNFILTSHLGIQIPPEGCWIKVGGEKQIWKKGKLTTIDTSFEHSTSNSGDLERHVLIIDFWHPELSEAERVSLDFVYDLRNKFESGQVPVRKARALQKQEEGFGSLWNKLTGKS